MIKIFLPNNLNFLYLSNLYLYVYNTNNFLLINTKNFNIFFNKFLNIIKLQKLKLIKKRSYHKNFLNLFLFSWDNFFFSKVYFLGKGFKLKKISNNIYFNFNYSHINFLISNKTIIKKVQKNKLLIFGKNASILKSISNNIVSIKRLNSYTKRGLRKTKQIVYKKRNKNNVQG